MSGAEAFARAALLASALLVAPVPALAQVAAPGVTREIVAKEIDVSRRGATLRLEFADRRELEIELRDGAASLGDDEIGSYGAGDALETAWRALLGEAVTLDDGPLAQRLLEWAPPAGLSGDDAAVAARIDAALEGALSDVDAGTAPAFASAGTDRALAELLDRPDELLQLARAIQGLDLDDVQVHVGENAAVAEGESVDGSVVVVDGDLDVDGEVDGDAVVVGGTLRLGEEGRVTGDVRLADGRIIRNGGEVLGDVTNLGDDPDETLGFLPEYQRERLRDEIREELEAELGDERPLIGPVSRLGDGISDLIELGFVILLVGVLGGGLAMHFARDELDVVAQAARRNPVQAGMVGLAGAFLVIPAWALGAVALIITIVGILAVPFWVVLFPIAFVLAVALGYLAVAQQIGEWVARRRLPSLQWVRLANPYSTMIAGVGLLMLAFALGRALSALGVLGFVSGLLTVLGILATVATALIGFGAVLLTRGGRRPGHAPGRGAYWGDNWDDDLAAAPASSASTPEGDPR